MGNPIRIPGESLAQICDLTVTYYPSGQPPLRALDTVNLEMRAGEVLGILGESGSGKSTLALSLMRLLPRHAQYDCGTMRLLGHDLLTLSEHELRKVRGAEIALIPQDPALALNPVMRVGTQLWNASGVHGSSWRRRNDHISVGNLRRRVGHVVQYSVGCRYRRFDAGYKRPLQPFERCFWPWRTRTSSTTPNWGGDGWTLTRQCRAATAYCSKSA